MNNPCKAKIMSAEAIASLVGRRTIHGAGGLVLTTGCFDLLHFGHMSLINEIAHRWPQYILVVGINTDDSVRRLKGLSRPIIPQDIRAEMVASLDSPYFVCLFDESTPEELCRKLKPKIFVKGGDYMVEDLPETAVVRRNGGQVHILPLVPGWSTTELLQRIRSTR
jgi:rfaE bifunctional protein nucleotidyltransferase chain/domain